MAAILLASRGRWRQKHPSTPQGRQSSRTSVPLQAQTIPSAMLEFAMLQGAGTHDPVGVAPDHDISPAYRSLQAHCGSVAIFEKLILQAIAVHVPVACGRNRWPRCHVGVRDVTNDRQTITTNACTCPRYEATVAVGTRALGSSNHGRAWNVAPDWLAHTSRHTAEPRDGTRISIAACASRSGNHICKSYVAGNCRTLSTWGETGP